jgi:serine/threonine protein kinase
MSEVWKRWEGQVLDRKYQLQQFLGSTDHSAVFLAVFRDPEPRQAAVKFVSADLANAEQQLADWNNAAKLSHPNLIQVYGTGHCTIEDMALLYVAMEYAEENLAQVLPQRALKHEETREMLNGVVDVLVYLHGKNLTHGRIKPSNVLASGDLLKLSSDTVLPAGEVREMRRERSAYDAPEVPASPSTPAADIWSLGVTVVEALTQQPAALPFDEQADPLIPPTVREPFLEIARHALRREAKLRWSSRMIAERLNPAAATLKAAAAGASAGASPIVGGSTSASPSANASVSASANVTVAPASPIAAAPSSPSPPLAWASPLSVPLSKEPAAPLTKQPAVPGPRRKVTGPNVRPLPTIQRRAITLPNYLVPLFAAVLVLVAIMALPKILRQREASAPAASSTSVSAGSASTPARASFPTSHAEPPAKEPAPEKAASNEVAKSTTVETPAPAPERPLTASSAPAPAVLRNSEVAPAPAPQASKSSPGRGEVLDQVLPEIPPKALATIHGTVRIGVKVHVDAVGYVQEATLDAPGPSKYFADLALKAAREWVFTSPEMDGRSLPSDWLIDFYLKQSGVSAVPHQVVP